MQVKSIEEIIEFLAPYAAETGVEIVEAKWTTRGSERSLTVYIDAPGGVDLNLCERFHRAIDGPLDELDPTYGAAYTLNCSSAGLDRPFKTAKDYARHIGEKVEIHLYAAQEGKKVHEGVLLSYDGGQVVIEEESGEKAFPVDKVAKACLYIEI